MGLKKGGFKICFDDGQSIFICPWTTEIFQWQYAFNLFSHNAPMTDNGYNEEEMKMVKETHKIWGRAMQQAVFIT